MLMIAAGPRHQARHPAPVADTDDPPAAEESVHVVKRGETLGGIAARAKIPRILIAEANGLKLPYRVHAGMRLALPRTRHHTVADGETGFDISYRYGVPFATIAVANGIKPSAVLKPGQVLLIPTVIGAAKPDSKPTQRSPDDGAATEAPAAARHFAWPLRGKVTRGFAPRGEADYHDGIDIAAPAGSAVRAAAGGTVIFAGTEPQSFGRLVVIDHGGEWQSAYGFLQRVTVAKGDIVNPHERIGLSGHSGKANHDELHFELRHANRPVDPLPQLPGSVRVAADASDEIDAAAPAKPARHHRKTQNTVPIAR